MNFLIIYILYILYLAILPYKILRLIILKSIYPRKIAGAGPNFSILSNNSDMLFYMDRSK